MGQTPVEIEAMARSRIAFALVKFFGWVAGKRAWATFLSTQNSKTGFYDFKLERWFDSCWNRFPVLLELGRAVWARLSRRCEFLYLQFYCWINFDRCFVDGGISSEFLRNVVLVKDRIYRTFWFASSTIDT